MFRSFRALAVKVFGRIFLGLLLPSSALLAQDLTRESPPKDEIVFFPRIGTGSGHGALVQSCRLEGRILECQADRLLNAVEISKLNQKPIKNQKCLVNKQQFRCSIEVDDAELSQVFTTQILASDLTVASWGLEVSTAKAQKEQYALAVLVDEQRRGRRVNLWTLAGIARQSDASTSVALGAEFHVLSRLGGLLRVHGDIADREVDQFDLGVVAVQPMFWGVDANVQVVWGLRKQEQFYRQTSLALGVTLPSFFGVSWRSFALLYYPEFEQINKHWGIRNSVEARYRSWGWMVSHEYRRVSGTLDGQDSGASGSEFLFALLLPF